MSGAKTQNTESMLNDVQKTFAIKKKVNLVVALGYNKQEKYSASLQHLKSIYKDKDIQMIVFVIPHLSHENFLAYKQDPTLWYHKTQLEEYRELV